MAIIRNVLDSEATGHENLSGAIIRPHGTVVPGGLMFCCGFFFFLFFVALCGAISPRWLGRSP